MNGRETCEIQLDGPYLDMLQLRQSGLCCSQIILKMLLRDLGRDNPDLVRAVAALCFGSGNPAGTCGVLTGAACALSLALEYNPGTEQQHPLLPLLLGELSDWFTAKTENSYGGITCGAILAASPDKRACSTLLIATFEKLKAMLATTGSAGN
jgi:hypothetical protein